MGVWGAARPLVSQVKEDLEASPFADSVESGHRYFSANLRCSGRVGAAEGVRRSGSPAGLTAGSTSPRKVDRDDLLTASAA